MQLATSKILIYFTAKMWAPIFPGPINVHIDYVYTQFINCVWMSMYEQKGNEEGMKIARNRKEKAFFFVASVVDDLSRRNLTRKLRCRSFD